MLEIQTYMVNEIASLPTRHSQAVELMKVTNVEVLERVDDIVNNWIEKVVEKMFPKSDQAERLVRDVWLNLLESEAIEAWKVDNSFIGAYVPAPFDEFDAVYIATMDVWGVSEEDADAAREVLRQLQNEELKIPVKEILQAAYAGRRRIEVDLSNIPTLDWFSDN